MYKTKQARAVDFMVWTVYHDLKASLKWTPRSAEIVQEINRRYNKKVTKSTVSRHIAELGSCEAHKNARGELGEVRSIRDLCEIIERQGL